MRIAFVTPYLPAPANTGGRIRMFRLAKALTDRGHRLSLFSCGGPRYAREIIGDAAFAIYETISIRNSDVGAIWPWQGPRRARDAAPLRLAWDIARAHKRERFDSSVVEHCYASAVVRSLGVPWVLDEHNVESAYAEATGRARGAQTGLAKEVERMRAWERSAWKNAAMVTCVTERDASVVRAHRASGVHVIPNGTAVKELAYVAPTERAKRGLRDVLFVGLMSHPPNERAAEFLAREVMPLLWKSRPEARLVLCGRQPSQRVKSLTNERVLVTDTVPSVAPYLERARVYANALFDGAGSSLKVPEAMASGCALVSTAVGARGFDDEGTCTLRAENASEFAAQIDRAWEASEEDDRRSLAAQKVAHRFDWDDLGARFAGLVEAAVAR